MTIRNSFAPALVLSALFLMACGPQWKVVTQAAPNPLAGQRKLALQPIDYAGLVITPAICAFTGSAQPETAWLEKHPQEDRDSFAADKAGINQIFANELISRARDHQIEIVPIGETTDASFVIQPSIPFMRQGMFAPTIRQMMMRVKIATRDGRVLDEFTMDPIPSDRGCFGRQGERLWQWGKSFAEFVEDYLDTRIHPGK